MKSLFLILLIIGVIIFLNIKPNQTTLSLAGVDPKISDDLEYELKEPVFSVTGQKKIPIIVKTSNNKQMISSTKLVPRKRFDDVNLIVVDAYPREISALSKEATVLGIYSDRKMDLFSYIEVSLKIHKTTPAPAGPAGQGTKVCILDTGIDDKHPWFNGMKIKKADFTKNSRIDGSAEDDNGHGTHVAGIVSKIVPKAELLIGKVCNKDGGCYTSAEIEAIKWCVENKADVVSMSFGSIWYQDSCESYPDVQLINDITEKNSVLFSMAAGNKECFPCLGYKVALPSCAEKGISVSAMDVHSIGVMINPSNYDLRRLVTICDKNDANCYEYDPGIKLIDMVANGYVESSVPGGGTEVMAGTSMATPHVSGAIALLKSINPSKSSEEIRQALYLGSNGINGYLKSADSCSLLKGDKTVDCRGYFTSIDDLGRDWSDRNLERDYKSGHQFIIKIDGQERKYSVRRTTVIINRGFDPIRDYYNKRYKGWTVKKIDNNLYLLTRRGQQTVHVWGIDRTYKGNLYILKEEKSDKRLRHAATSFMPLEKCEVVQSSCRGQIVEETSLVNYLFYDIKS